MPATARSAGPWRAGRGARLRISSRVGLPRWTSTLPIACGAARLEGRNESGCKGVRLSVELKDIEAAARVIAGQVIVTPCLASRTLSEVTGAEIYLKFENHQFTASFKERGALTKLASLDAAQAAKGVIACSAGNHAQGVAYHAHRLGIPAVIVMPRHTPYVKVEQTPKHGAEVILEGENFDGAMACAIEMAVTRGLTLVHPYDDERIIAGQGTCGVEM